MIGVGGVTLGIPYVLGLPLALRSNERAFGWLFAPGIGPWITAVVLPTSCSHDNDSVDCGQDTLWRSIMVIDGIVQTAGIAMIIVGATTTKRRLVRDSWSLSFQPLRVGTGYGFGFSGQL